LRTAAATTKGQSTGGIFDAVAPAAVWVVVVVVVEKVGERMIGRLDRAVGWGDAG
jgi:hypothetical protein